jgi:signal transduction histidine kinase
MRSYLGPPATNRGRALGRLYLTNKQNAAEFSPDDQALVETFAQHAAIAIDNAQLYGKVQRLAVVDEQDRISRELHDSIIQSIYGVTLSLDDVPVLVSEAPDEARQRVDDAIDALHGVIRDIRNFIFGLRPLVLDSGSLAEGLRTLADEMRRNTATAIDIVGEEPTVVSLEVVAELLAIAREALANVARHSSAAHAAILVADPGSHVRLEISDDGRGIDFTSKPPGGHHGLANMRARAEALDGTFEVQTGSAAGTRIIVLIPRAGSRRGATE